MVSDSFPGCHYVDNFFSPEARCQDNNVCLTMAGSAAILSREKRFSDCLDIVAFRRASPLRVRTRLTPLPVCDLGHVIAILGNILLVFE